MKGKIKEFEMRLTKEELECIWSDLFLGRQSHSRHHELRTDLMDRIKRILDEL